jgi:hypothetical protein
MERPQRLFERSLTPLDAQQRESFSTPLDRAVVSVDSLAAAATRDLDLKAPRGALR